MKVDRALSLLIFVPVPVRLVVRCLLLLHHRFLVFARATDNPAAATALHQSRLLLKIPQPDPAIYFQYHLNATGSRPPSHNPVAGHKYSLLSHDADRRRRCERIDPFLPLTHRRYYNCSTPHCKQSNCINVSLSIEGEVLDDLDSNRRIHFSFEAPRWHSRSSRVGRMRTRPNQQRMRMPMSQAHRYPSIPRTMELEAEGISTRRAPCRLPLQDRASIIL